MATDKHTNRVLSNVLLDNDIKSDMVEAIAHVPFSMHQYYCTPNSNFRGYNCTLKKFPVPPKWWRRGYAALPPIKNIILFPSLHSLDL